MYYNTRSKQVLFKYQTGRAAEWPKGTLKNYQGYLQIDGYAAYNQFDNVKASEVLMQIQYAVEKYGVENNYTLCEIKNYRQYHALPLLTTLHQILQTQLITGLPKSLFTIYP